MSAENPTPKPEGYEVSYTDSLEGVTPERLQGFFDGWGKQPSPETLLKLLEKSDHRILALDEKKLVIGFITAVSDGVLSAYIPFLEVLPEHKDKGIGSKLTSQMLEKLKDLYMVDLVCDPALQPFYEKLGMKQAAAMTIRNFDKQDGKAS